MSAEELVAETWRGLVQRQSSNASAAEAVLDELMRAYREPARHYHTLIHIGALLRQLEAYSGAVGNRDAVALAIIFHVVGYDPRRQDNEQQSAVVGRARVAALGFPATMITHVATYIEGTLHGREIDG